MDEMLHGEYFYNYDKIRISSDVGVAKTSEINDRRHYGICYVEGDNLYLTDENKRVFLNGNTVFLLSNSSKYKVEHAEGKDVKYMSIDFKAELFGHMVRDYSDFSEIIKFLFNSSGFKRLDMNDNYYFSDATGRIKSLFHNAWVEYKTRNFKWEEVVKNNIYQIILEFVRTLDSHEVSHIQSDLVQSMVDYLEFNWNKKITLKEVAEKFTCSESYITKLFKKEFGMSLTEYMKQRKIFASINLLKENYKIREVAKMVGYDDAEIFAKHFNYYVGMTPSEYRRKTRRLQPWYDDMKDLKEQIQKI